jgi:hypothetical protein
MLPRHFDMKFVRLLFSPLVFGLGFIAPLAAQLLTAAGLTLPGGIDNLYAGLLIGGLLGLMAQVRGSWVWARV